MTKSADRAELLDLLGRCTRQVLSELQLHEFRRDDQLELLGANSMDRADIIALVLESLRLEIPRTALFGPKNLGELVDLLHDKLQGR